jgi:hypothetical protein
MVFIYLVISASILATSVIMEASRRSAISSFEVWQPFVWEYSSAISIMLLLPLISYLIKKIPLNGTQLKKTLIIYLTASIIFSAFHIAMMVGLRKVIYWTQELSYIFGDLSFELLYEYRKDLWSFIFIIAVIKSYQFVLSRIQGEANIIADGEDNEPKQKVERLLVKKLGKEFIIKVDDIEWLESSGNYVNLHIKGRIYPIRSTLNLLIEQISHKGFCRIHRSHGLNLDSIESITPLSSGDSEVRLINGKTLNLSRRYKDNLKLSLK